MALVTFAPAGATAAFRGILALKFAHLDIKFRLVFVTISTL